MLAAQVWETLLSVLEGGKVSYHDSVERLADIGVSAVHIERLQKAGITTLSQLVEERQLAHRMKVDDDVAYRWLNATRRLLGTIWDEWAVDILVELLEFWAPPRAASPVQQRRQSTAWRPVQCLVAKLVREILVNKIPSVMKETLSQTTRLNLPDLPDDPQFAEASAAMECLRRTPGLPPKLFSFLHQVRSKLASRNPSLQRSALATLLAWLKSNQGIVALLTGPQAKQVLRDAPVRPNAATDSRSSSSRDSNSPSLEPRLYSAPPDGRIPTVLDDIVYLVIDINCIRAVSYTHLTLPTKRIV